ncbi:MAG: histidinol-phosphate transaminase, partial [Halanaerobiaceae bacterium]
EQPQDKKYIKLNTNENPYPPSPEVIEAIKNFNFADLRLYPDPECSDLKKVISEYYNIGQENIFLGNGSDEVLAFTFMAFFDKGSRILFPEVTYSFYPVYCDIFNIDYYTIDLNDDFTINVEQFKQDNGGIIFPNPNAPTGIYLSLEKVGEILSNNMENVVVIDEAYIDFGGESAVGLIENYPNLLVIKTMSKSRSMAGMRVGYAMGHEELIKALDSVKNSFNSYTLDKLAITAAVNAIKDVNYFNETREKIIKTRIYVDKQLNQMGFNILPSMTNFIFASHPDYHAEHIFDWLKKEGILIRYFKDEKVDNYIRITIGTDQEMQVFLDKIKQYLLNH